MGLNAGTSAEATTYYYSLPTNKFELFAYLESERFLHPVFREFYKERDVVMEERRQRTESQPIGKLVERMLATAFLAHPYKQPTVGYMSDLQRFTMTDAEQFFRKYYVPSNMVTAIVGDVKAAEIIPVAREVFRPAAEGREACAPAHAGAAAGRRALDHPAREVAADLHRGLPPAVGAASRRRRLRRHLGDPRPRPDVAPVRVARREAEAGCPGAGRAAGCRV